jgi:hypothetical protein
MWPMLQEVVLIETGKIPVKAAIESPLDKLTMIDQRLSDRASIARSGCLTATAWRWGACR